MPIPKALSLSEISARSGLSVYALQRAIKNGQLKAFKVDDAPNSTLKVLEEDFTAFIELRKNALATDHARSQANR